MFAGKLADSLVFFRERQNCPQRAVLFVLMALWSCVPRIVCMSIIQQFGTGFFFSNTKQRAPPIARPSGLASTSSTGSIRVKMGSRLTLCRCVALTSWPCTLLLLLATEHLSSNCLRTSSSCFGPHMQRQWSSELLQIVLHSGIVLRSSTGVANVPFANVNAFGTLALRAPQMNCVTSNTTLRLSTTRVRSYSSRMDFPVVQAHTTESMTCGPIFVLQFCCDLTFAWIIESGDLRNACCSNYRLQQGYRIQAIP